MLFDRKLTTDKGQVKAYNKAQEIINSKLNESADIMTERIMNLNESFASVPISSQAIRRRTNARISKAKENITKKLFMENFFDLYKESLLLDEDFINIYDENLYKLCESVFENLMNEGIISWNSIKKDSSKFIMNLYNLCEETAEKNATMNVTPDSVKKSTVSDDSIINEKDKDEEVDEKDKEKIDEKTKDSKKKVASVVKDKVVETLKKEKEASEEEAEKDEEIKEKSKTKKEKESEEAEEETDEQETNEETPEEDSETEEKEEDDKEIKSESYYFKRTPTRIRNNSLFRSIQLNISEKAVKESSLNENVKINMDMIFAESIAYYTLLETLNTVGITNLHPSDLRNLCTKLIIK